MELLLIIFIILIAAALILTYLLYKSLGDAKKHSLAFIANFVLVVILSILAFTSLPSNYIVQKVIALFWIALALVATVLKSRLSSKSTIPEITLTISLLAALAQTLFI